MSGSQPSNNQAVQFEQQQAAEADAKEAQRQQRLTQGQAAINAVFSGTPEMANTTSNYDWSTFQAPAAASPSMNPSWAGAAKPTGAPAGYTAVSIPGTSAAGATTGADGRPTLLKGTPNTANALTMNSNNTLSGYNAGGGGAGGTTTAAPTWGLQDASGKTYKPGDPLSITTQTPTGKMSGGFGDDFYNQYKNTYLDFYEPDEQRQYDTSKRDLGYSLARAGLTNSSVAGDKQGDLAYQDAINKAKIVNDANNATGQVQSQVQNEKQSLINQLYSTEDPTLTANLAESAASGLKLASPTLTPAAALFTPALVGATSALGAATSPYGYGGGAPTGGAVRNASSSSGKAYQGAS